MWRACRSTQLASYFYWYLSVECNDAGKDNTASVKYDRIRLQFLDQLRNVISDNCNCCIVLFVYSRYRVPS